MNVIVQRLFDFSHDDHEDNDDDDLRQCLQQ